VAREEHDGMRSDTLCDLSRSKRSSRDRYSGRGKHRHEHKLSRSPHGRRRSHSHRSESRSRGDKRRETHRREHRRSSSTKGNGKHSGADSRRRGSSRHHRQRESGARRKGEQCSSRRIESIEKVSARKRASRSGDGKSNAKRYPQNVTRGGQYGDCDGDSGGRDDDDDDDDDDEGSVGSLADFIVLSDKEQDHKRLGEETDYSFMPSEEDDDDEEDEEDENSEDSESRNASVADARERGHRKSRIVEESDSDLPSEVLRSLKRHRKDSHRSRRSEERRACDRSEDEDHDGDASDDIDTDEDEQSQSQARRRRIVCGARRQEATRGDGRKAQRYMESSAAAVDFTRLTNVEARVEA